jgi:gliding motility-associated-like protein
MEFRLIRIFYHRCSAGTYDVSIMASCGEANLSTQILASDTCDEQHTFFIPNVFSPNGDGINDVFSISAHEEIEIQNLDISMFDRWGNLIFLSHEKAFAWTDVLRMKI